MTVTQPTRGGTRERFLPAATPVVSCLCQFRRAGRGQDEGAT